MNHPAPRQVFIALSIVLFCLAASYVSADDTATQLEELARVLPALTASQREALLATGELSNPLSAGDGLELVPTDAMRMEMETGFAEIESTVGMEVLFLIADPLGQYSMEDLATKILEMSTLGGVEYYSESKERMRTLFTDSYTIDNAEDRNRIADRVVSGSPSDGVVHVRQRDTTFGWNTNTIEYWVEDLSLHTLTTNDSSFSWAFIPIIRAGRLHSHLLVLRSDNYMVYYANFGAHAMQVSFFERQIHDSFYNRLVALKDWFQAKLDD